MVEARSRLAGLDESELESAGLLFELATAHALLGDEERAIDELGRSLKKDPGDYFVSLVLPPFHALLDNPTFPGPLQRGGNPVGDLKGIRTRASQNMSIRFGH